MDDILHVTEATVCGPHALDLMFSNGVRKKVDLTPYLEGEIFQPLLDPAYFACVVVDPVCKTVVWPNGADFAPEALFDLPDIAGRKSPVTKGAT